MMDEPERQLLIQAEAAYTEATSDPRRALAIAADVAQAARSAQAAEALVVALRAAGYAARDLYDHPTSERHLDEAAAIARSEGLDARLCEVLITRLAMRIELGQPLLARRDLREARAVASERQRPEVEFATALLEDTTGNLAAAAAAYRRALSVVGPDDGLLRFKVLNNLALIVTLFGHHEEAERLLRSAIALAKGRWKAREAVATESYAIVAVESGRPVEALRRYDRAEQLLTEVGIQLVELYRGKARALLTLQLLDEAADAAAQAVAHVDGVVGGSLMLAEALLPQARVALAQRRLDDAVDAASQAERLFRQQRRAGWGAEAALISAAARALRGPDEGLIAALDQIERTMRRIGNAPGVVEAALLQGDVCAMLGRTRKARRAFRRAAGSGAQGPVLLRLQSRTAAAREAELAGDVGRLRRTCRQGLDELASYRATVASVELRERAAAHGTTLAALGLRSVIPAARAEQVWAWLERSSSVAFVPRRHQADEGLQALLGQLRSAERELEERAPDDGALGELLRRIDRLERQVRATSWTRPGRTDDWLRPTIRTLRQLRAALGSRILLQYGMVDGRLHGVAVTRGRVRRADFGPVDHPLAWGRQLAFALRRMTHPHSSTAAGALAFDSARSDLQRLAEQLLTPVLDDVVEASEIIVAPPSRLVGLPWATLGPLADRPVRVVPSALSWWLGHQGARSDGATVLVAGPGLPGAADEVHSISRRHRGPLVLTGRAATTRAVGQAASGARLVHVAAHGRLRSDSPTFSSLQLTDGPLTVHDLLELREPAHQWVLAACDLGQPGKIAGPALEGVVAALLSGGAGSVIAATVSVPDLDTRDLMVELHQCLVAGESMPEALRRARAAVDPASPTGFVAGTAFSCYGGG